MDEKDLNVKELISPIPNQFLDFTFLDKLKNNIVLLIAIVYGLGYLGWSVYSAINNLGIVPAFNLQYLLAGILPFLFLYVTVYYFSNSNRFLLYLDKTLNRKAIGKYKFFRKLLIYTSIICFVAMPLILICLSFIKDNSEDIIITSMLTFISFASYTISLLPFDATPFPCVILRKRNVTQIAFIKKTKKSFDTIRKTYHYAIIFSLSIAIFPFFFIYLFAEIPQELGGAKPKKCVLISDKNIFKIEEKAKPEKNSPVQFKDTVIVFYENSSVIIYKRNVLNSEVFEISRSNIQNIIWLN